MFASNLSEIKSLATLIAEELNIIIPAFVKRANDKYGKGLQSYIISTNDAISKLARDLLSELRIEDNPGEISLLDYENNTDAEIKVASAILYEQSHGHSYKNILKLVSRLSQDKRHQIIRTYTKFRGNRRHRPGRAFEMVNYTFDMFTNFGMFRDLHRHRILTLERQSLSTRHGYDTPLEIVDLGIEKDYRDCMYKCKEAYELIESTMPQEAQYVVNFAYRYPYFMRLNLRQACHMIELRTIPQGHQDYRKICQLMFRQIQTVNPVLAEGIRFVDLEIYPLERFDAEKKTESKRRENHG
jgi:thymidylate synthase ThyX